MNFFQNTCVFVFVFSDAAYEITKEGDLIKIHCLKSGLTVKVGSYLSIKVYYIVISKVSITHVHACLLRYYCIVE